MATFPLKNFRAVCDYWFGRHKCRAIPLEETALTFIKRPIEAGPAALGTLLESLSYRKIHLPARLSCAAAHNNSSEA
jgi:hypothetical protein